MASATTGSHASSDPFDLGIHTPPNLAGLARASLLRNSSPVVSRPIGVSDALRRPAQTPSSPLVRLSNAAATEGAQCEATPIRPVSAESVNLQPVSICEAANRLAREQTEAYNAKLTVFRAFCESFEQTAKQFTSGLEHGFAERFSSSFLDFWSQALSDLKSAPAPTYSSIAAGRTTNHPSGGHTTAAAAAPQQQRPQQSTSRLQGRPIPAPPKEDLRVFVRLDAGAPARDHSSYAIRTHIAAKVGIDLHRVPAAFKVNSGWAIRTTDAAIRDLIVQRQSEWSEDLDAASVEVGQKWFTYVVSNCPRRLTDLQGNEVNYDVAVKDEIACQTGCIPISIRASRHDTNDLPSKTLIVSFLEPTQRPWRLFGSSRLARYIDKPSMPSQCDKCWDFHARHSCDRQPSCKRCGKNSHGSEACTAPEQCANCLGPHAADFSKCPARPKRSHGIFRRLTREEKILVRQLGAQLSAQQGKRAEPGAQPEQPERHPAGSLPRTPGCIGSHSPEVEERLHDNEATSTTQPDDPEIEHRDDRSRGESVTSVLSSTRTMSPLCIVVATTPQPQSEDDEPRPASPSKKRRISPMTLSP